MSLVLPRILTLLALGGAALGAHQSAPAPAGTALIIGRVIDGVSGVAVNGVTVVLQGPASAAVLVDSKGRFVFRDVPAGRFTLSGVKAGYQEGFLGKLRIDGPSPFFDLSAGQRLVDAEVRIWRLGSISGRVVDDADEPIIDASIAAYKIALSAGRPNLVSAYYSLNTDDRGSYRIGDLAPGSYIVGVSSRINAYPMSFVEADAAATAGGPAARRAWLDQLSSSGGDRFGWPALQSVRIGEFLVGQTDGKDMPVSLVNGRLWVYPFTFHPAARTPGTATAVTVAPGEPRDGVDIHVTLTPTVRVSGTLRGPDGPLANFGLRLSFPAEEYQPTQNGLAETITDANGAFSFFGVPSGRYTLTTAFGVARDIGTEMPVAVGDRDLADVAMVLRPQTRVTGRVVFDGSSPAPPSQNAALRIALDPADGKALTPVLLVDPSGNARSSVALTSGKYFVRVVTPTLRGNQTQTWTLKSAMLGGRDVSDMPFAADGTDITGLVVTFTDHPQTLSGTVHDAQGAVDPGAAVLVFPTDNALWIDYGVRPRRLLTATTDRAGAFKMTGLPDGDYFAVAVPDATLGVWQDPAFLRAAAQHATRLKIDGGASQSIDLRTSRW